MNFLSDNAATPCPEVLAAVATAAPATAGAYDGDPLSQRLDAVFGDLFGAPCTVLPVGTGTAAKLAVMVPPFGAVVCHDEAHIHVDECGAPEFFTGGAKLNPRTRQPSRRCAPGAGARVVHHPGHRKRHGVHAG